MSDIKLLKQSSYLSNDNNSSKYRWKFDSSNITKDTSVEELDLSSMIINIPDKELTSTNIEQRTLRNIDLPIEKNGYTIISDPNHRFCGKLDVTALPGYGVDFYRYRFQGFTMTNKNIYLTAHGASQDKSLIMVYDQIGNYKGIIYLPFELGGSLCLSHVGGISYDSTHDVIYITGEEGKIISINNSFLESTINNGKNVISEEFFSSNNFLNINSSEIMDWKIKRLENYSKNGIYDSLLYKQKDAASVYYDDKDQKIYVPTFSSNTEIYVFDVKYGQDQKPEYVLDTIYGYGEDGSNQISNTNLPYGVQGVATYMDKNDEKYILMTGSYGGCTSVITKYKINNDNSLTFSGQKVFENECMMENQCVVEGQCGLENIIIYDDGTIYGNVENYVGGKKDQDGGEFIITNVDDINGSATDSKYLEIMARLKQVAISYDNDLSDLV